MIPGSAAPLLLGQTGGDAFSIERSLRFNSGDSSKISRTPSSASNRKTWTMSYWVKRAKLSTEQMVFSAASSSSDRVHFYYASTDNIAVYSPSFYYTTNVIASDPGAWQHLVFACDTTQSTDTDRFKIYVNSVLVTSFVNQLHPSQNLDTPVSNNILHQFSGRGYNSSNHADVYLAEINFVDGQALDPTSFGAFDDNGVWRPKDTAGLTFGTNGFRLQLADNSGATATTLGKDTSGNSNNFTPNNLSVTAGSGNDSLVDTPTNGDTASDTGAGGEITGNYATLNPLHWRTDATFSDGNLRLAASTFYRSGVPTIPLDNGKWYFEGQIITDGANGYSMIGVTTTPEGQTYSGANTGDDGFAWYSANGALYPISGSYDTWAVGDIVSVAYDSVTRKTWIAKNDTWQNSGDPAAGTGSVATIPGTDSVYFSIATGTSGVVIANFGQRAFAYTAPSGYKALCTSNLPEPTIADGSKYFDTKLYSGDGTNGRAITGLDYSPDLVWIKARNQTDGHLLYDIVRGATKALKSNNTNAEATDSNSLTAFNSDGFTVGSNASNAQVNRSGFTYAAWAWDASSSTTTVAAGANGTNLPGTACQVRANTSAGFSIVKVDSPNGTEARVHGLNAKPDLIIGKALTGSQQWHIYHSALGKNYYGTFTTNAFSSSDQWGSQEPDSTYFYVKTNTGSGANYSGGMIYYIWTSVEAYSAMGSYQGNGNADGPFVYTGFKVAWLMVKNTTTSGETWTIYDAARDPHNLATNRLQPNAADAETSGTVARDKDFLSNGFKVRGTSGEQNTSGDNYIYLALAENPFASNGGLAR